MKILLVRHGESEANVDKRANHAKADHAIDLSPRGRGQATKAGEFLARYFVANPDYTGHTYPIETVDFKKNPGRGIPGYEHQMHIIKGNMPFRLWNSPYNRARQTADNILAEIENLTKAVPAHGRREHINLVEEQYGVFDGLEDEECAAKFPHEWEHYKKTVDMEGRFWARRPLGESRFDVAVRVHQAFGTFQRDAEKHGIRTIVVVAHGTTIRAFLMQWLHLPYEWFEKESNPKNCSIRLVDDQEDHGYIYPGEGA